MKMHRNHISTEQERLALMPTTLYPWLILGISAKSLLTSKRL